MNYQNLYFFLIIIGLGIIFWSVFKIRILLIENTRLRMKLSCSKSDNEVLRWELKYSKPEILQDELQKLKYKNTMLQKRITTLHRVSSNKS